MPDHIQRQSGFTLIELLIVVAIIGILSAIALPAYNDYMLKGKLAEAFTELSGAQTKMEQAYQDNRSYGNPAGTTCWINNVSGNYFDLTCATSAEGATPSQHYVFTATGKGATAGFTYTVDDAGAKKTTAVPSAAYGAAPLTCWVKSKGGC